MPMSSGGHAASSSGCATSPRASETGSHVFDVQRPASSHIGHYVMATAEHREPCDSRGSCTVLGAPGGESPSGDSTETVLAANSTECPLTPLFRAKSLRRENGKEVPCVTSIVGPHGGAQLYQR